MKYFSLSYLITFCVVANAAAGRFFNNSSNFTNNTTLDNYSLNAIAKNNPHLLITHETLDNDWLFHQSGDHAIIIRENGFNIEIFTKEVKNNTFNKLVLLENLGYQEIKQIIQACENTTISELTVSIPNIDTELVVQFLQELQKTNITNLVFKPNSLNTHDLYTIAEEIAKTNIATLEISDSHVRAQELTNLILGLKCSKIKELKVSKNNINPLDLEISGEFLSAIEKTDIISLNIKGITDKNLPIYKAMQQILQSHQQTNSLESSTTQQESSADTTEPNKELEEFLDFTATPSKQNTTNSFSLPLTLKFLGVGAALLGSIAACCYKHFKSGNGYNYNDSTVDLVGDDGVTNV